METLSSFDSKKFDVRSNLDEPWSSPWLETTLARAFPEYVSYMIDISQMWIK
jgi:hypothetical protein